MKLSIGFIGFGNIASAIVNGMISSGKFSAGEIGVYDIVTEKINEFKEKYGIAVFSSPQELAENCNAVLFAVKPNDLQTALSELNATFCREKPLIISVAAGKEIKSIEGCFSEKQRIVRVMPNINAKVSEAASAICGNELASEADIVFTEKVFNSVGKAVIMKEDLFSVFCAAAGSAPAFAYMLLNSIASAAVKNGAYKAPALKIISELTEKYSTELFEDGEDLQKLVNDYLNNSSSENNCEIEKFYKAVNEAITGTKDKDIKMKLDSVKK